MKVLLAALMFVASAWAQDTYHCPDGWLLEENSSGLVQKPRAVMTLTTTKVNGPGSIRTRPLNGLIGLTVNPTTGTTRTAWCWPNSTDHYSPLPGITTGTTGFVREQVHTTFVRKNANKLI